MRDAAFLVDVDQTILLYEDISGHAATRTRQMIEQYGEVDALSRLVVSSDLQQGFKALRDSDRLMKTFEAVIVRHEHLFRSDIVKAAQWRLDQADQLERRPHNN